VDQFRTAFDVYLDILHLVNARVQASLGQNTHNWRALNICPPCMYKLEDEPPLKFSILLAQDGNSSLKHVDHIFKAGQPRLDTRTWRSDMWLSPGEVDVFRDDVAIGKAKVGPSITYFCSWLIFS
jgi:hypothetical protein